MYTFLLETLCRRGRRAAAGHCNIALRFMKSQTLSGISEMLSIPSDKRKSANSGMSLGPCPQIPILTPALLHASIAIFIRRFTAGCV